MRTDYTHTQYVNICKYMQICDNTQMCNTRKVLYINLYLHTFKKYCIYIYKHNSVKQLYSNTINLKIDSCFVDYAKAFDCVDHNKLWKILKKMGIPDHLSCLLRNLYAGQEVTELDMKQQTGSKLGKEYIKAVYCHPAYLTYMQSTS